MNRLPAPLRSVVAPSLALWVLAVALGLLQPPLAHALPSIASADRPQEGAEGWEKTIELVSRAVVTLRVRGTRDFDTESPGGSTGTGFVIDKEQGLILTNRHMVHAGPVIAEAVFLNHEEVSLEPVYRDPVHDFGFYRFDPADVRYMQVEELELRPDRARVGVDLRIIGNDSGEKISILSGTLARLDREAPRYGSRTYNDFNTFYLQAASNTSGGSSGSPVVDRSGAVIGLNAGSRTNTASAYYLPLDRVVRAVPYVLRGEQPPRGTLQTTFTYTPFDELGRLGLSSAVESSVRAAAPDRIGMLVVDSLVPGGPAEGHLLPGDILLQINGEPMQVFVDVARALDGAVESSDRAVSVQVERGGEPLTFELQAGDLHAISPASFLEVGRAILHPLSYMQARNHNVPVQGIYLAQSGYTFGQAGVSARSLIDTIDGEPTPDLDSLERILERKPHGARLRVGYRALSDPKQERVAVVTHDRLWHTMRRCALDPQTGRWPCVLSPEPPAPSAPEPVNIEFPAGTTRAGRALARSLVTVHFEIPYPTSGVKNTNYRGAGIVIDAERGLVLTDRDTVPVLLGDLEISFAGQLRVPGSVRYLHPVHNLAIVQYDPAHLQGTQVRAARFRHVDLEPGDRVWQIGLDASGDLVEYPTRVARTGSILLGASRTPRFRDINIEGVSLVDSLTSVGGVLTDRRGRVVAGWLSFMDHRRDRAGLRGLPSAFLTRVVEPLRAGEPVDYRFLGAELRPLGLDAARDRGLSQARIGAIVDQGERQRHIFQVRRVWGGTPASELLRNGDLLISAEGVPITRELQLEALSHATSLDLRVLRDGVEQDLTLPTVGLGGGDTDRIVQWAGLIVHEPHLQVAAQTGQVHEGVYGSWVWYGTPAYDASLRPTRYITAIDGEPVATLNDLLRIVADQRDGQAVRITSKGLDGQVQVHTLKVDLQFWPAIGFHHNGERWQRTELVRSEASGAGEATELGASDQADRSTSSPEPTP